MRITRGVYRGDEAKRKVPSDLSTSLVRPRHARCEHRSRDRRAPRPQAPQPPVSRRLLQCPRTRRWLCPARCRILATAFRSPATAAPLRASLPGSTFPACRFRSRPACLQPVRPFGSTSKAGLHQPWRLLCLEPVAGFPLVMARLADCLHSPPGLLHPSGSKRSAAFRRARHT